MKTVSVGGHLKRNGKPSKQMVALIDDEDFERVSNLKWSLTWSKDTESYYATRKHKDKNGRLFALKMHRFVLDVKDSRFVDHKNMDTLDNQKSNLRYSNASTNKFNSKKRVDSTTGFKGVHYRPDTSMYRAYINKEGVRTNLGQYKNAQDAARAYNEAAKRLHGEFANLNPV